MFVLGLVLLVLAVLFAAGVVASSSGEDLRFFGQTFDIPSAGGLFLAGVVTAAIAALGLMLMMAGLAHAKKKRAERKALKRTGNRAETLAEENARLKAELSSTMHSGGAASSAYPGEPGARDQRARVVERQHKV